MSWTELNKIIKRYKRAKVYDVKSLDKSSRRYLDDYYEAPSGIQYGTNKELEALADVWAFIDENMRREEWQSYTREDWARLEYEYVERAHYTKEDLFDDVLTKYERGLFTAEEAQAYTKQFRECKYRFCYNVFKPKRKNNEYCPGSDCANREANAIIQFKKTGTYLPPSVYKENRNDTDAKNYQEKEIAFNLGEAGNEDHEESNEQVINKIYQSHQRHLKGAGKRDENRDMYYDKKDAENIEESPVILHQNHVYSRRAI